MIKVLKINGAAIKKRWLRNKCRDVRIRLNMLFLTHPWLESFIVGFFAVLLLVVFLLAVAWIPFFFWVYGS